MPRDRWNDDDSRDESEIDEEFAGDSNDDGGSDEDGGHDGNESATMPCPRCRRDVWEDADRCPRCGYYLTDDEMDAEERASRRGFNWKWVSVALLAVFALYLWRLIRA